MCFCVQPIGAQTPERLAQFLKRFREWDDPSGETPPYMYGTHYSSAMIVLSYLVRLEPFTQQFLKLQVCVCLCLFVSVCLCVCVCLFLCLCVCFVSINFLFVCRADISIWPIECFIRFGTRT